MNAWGRFSDGVFAVIITIMVLELKTPEHPPFAALAPLWPTALSYAASYEFIAIVWMNHHHLLRFTNDPTQPKKTTFYVRLPLNRTEVY